MPISTTSHGSSDPDTYSLLSQAPSTMTTISESLPAQLVRKSARIGFTFNIMSVGPPGLGKTVLLSALFNKNLETSNENERKQNLKDPLNPPISINSKQFEIEEKKVRLKLTVVECKNYGEALCSKDTHKPLVDYIDSQFADFHRRESSFDRRNIQDKMIHCLFFFISPIGHGLSKLDIEFLKAVDGRVNIIPIIAKAEALTSSERTSFKIRVRNDFERNNIKIYKMPDADPDDTDELKRYIKAIQEALPFAICSMNLKDDNSIADRSFEWGSIDLYNRDHSDFLLLKTMLNMQMPDLCDATHSVFYEDYRLRMMPNRPMRS